MNKGRIIWSLVVVLFVLSVVGVFYFVNRSSYAVFTDNVVGKKTMELSVSSEGTCTSNVNDPLLVNGMIPVYFDGSDNSWKKADIENVNYSWYNYCEQKWANAVTVENNRDMYQKAKAGTSIKLEDINAMFVWIPRYKYQIFNFNHDGNSSVTPAKIHIGFETKTETTGDLICEYTDLNEKCTVSQQGCIDDICNNKVYTHPSFEDKYTGFWVSKFELTGKLDKIGSVPSTVAITNASVSKFNDAISDMNKKNNIYGFDDSVSVNMINNLQWGAIAYLSNSRFGSDSEIGINNCSRYITGVGSKAGSSLNDAVCNNTDNTYYGKEGVFASTTGNVYGVYDMSGGAYEYVLGVVSEDGYMVPGLSGYTSSEKIDKINLYKNSSSATDVSISMLGDGIREVKNQNFSWYGDLNNVAYSKWPWFIRGGSAKNGNTAGIFASGFSSGTAGEDFGTRIVITKE